MKKILLILLPALLAMPIMSTARRNAKAGQPATINVMSYNIRMNTPLDGVNAWPLRVHKVTGLLRFHQADIFGVQEALPEQVQDLIAAFPEFDHLGVGRDDGKSAGEHMSVFYRKSRFEKLDGGTFWLNEDTTKPGFGWDAACNRTVTWLKLKDRNTGKSFYFLNTHFDHRGSTARVESAKLVAARIQQINREKLPLILMGDFNATPDSEPIRIILGHLKDSRGLSETPPYGPNATSGGFEVKEMTRTIDFIFVNDRLRILRHGNLADTYGVYYPSDHLAVLAEVELK